MVKIGDVELGSSLVIVGIVNEPIDHNKLDHLPDEVKIIELRIDTLLPIMAIAQIKEYILKIKDKKRFAILITVRQDGIIDRTLKQQLIEDLLPFADAVDVEIECKIRTELIALCKQKGKSVIVSFHDFNGTPQYQQLKHILREAEGIGADIVKIAVMAKAKTNLFELYQFLDDNQESNLIGISMGEFGKASRVEAFNHGSLLTYAPLTKSNAPGQLTVDEIVKSQSSE